MLECIRRLAARLWRAQFLPKQLNRPAAAFRNRKSASDLVRLRLHRFTQGRDKKAQMREEVVLIGLEDSAHVLNPGRKITLLQGSSRQTELCLLAARKEP